MRFKRGVDIRLRLEASELSAVYVQAAREGASISAWVRRAIRERLDRCYDDDKQREGAEQGDR